MSSRLRIRSMLLPLAAIAALAMQIIAPAPVWKGLLTAFGGLWLASYLWARMLQKNLSLERQMRYGWAQVGDRLEEQFVLHNEGLLPATWVEISDGSTLPGYSVAQATGIEGNSQNTWRTSGSCTRRGVFTLGHTRLSTGDPLGIYSVELVQPEAVTLTVLPPVVPLPFAEAAGGWQGEGRPRPRAAEQTLSAETVRPYLPGDSLRLMHWPTSARLGEPYVRVLEGSPASDWWIVLDLDAAVQAAPDEAESTLELGVIIAGSLAERGVRAHHAVGLVASSDPPVWIRPEGGEPQRWEILRRLASVQAGKVPLPALLEGAGPALGRQSNVFIVTPSTQAGWVSSLSRLARRGTATTAILIDPRTFGDERSNEPLQHLLEQAGVMRHVIGRELFKRPEARPGPSGQWEWRLLPTGKAVPIRRPTDMTWKNLG